MPRRRTCKQVDRDVDRKLLATMSQDDFVELEYELTTARDAIESILFSDARQEAAGSCLAEEARLRLESDMLHIDHLRADLMLKWEPPGHFEFIDNANWDVECWGDPVGCRSWPKILMAGKRHGRMSTKMIGDYPIPHVDSSHMDRLLGRLIAECVVTSQG